MKALRHSGRVNVRSLVILVLVVGMLGCAAVVGHYVRKRIVTANALAAGKAELDQGNWSDACKHLKVYLSKYPDDVEILEEYARARLAIRPLEAGNIGYAIGAYRRLLRHKPADEMVCSELARLYHAVREYDDAAYICRERLKAASSDATAMLWLGKALAAQHKYDEANELLTSLVTQHGEQVEGYLLLSALAMQKGESSSKNVATDWLNQAVQAVPDSAEARVERARHRRANLNDLAGARGDLETASALQPDDPRVMLLLAVEWTSLGDLDRAHDAMEAVAEVDPDTLADSNISPAGFVLARSVSAAKLTLLRGENKKGVELADQTLARLSDQWRVKFLPVAARLYVAGACVDKARGAVNELRAAVELTSDAKGSMYDELALIDAAVSDAEGRWYAVIALLEDRVSVDPGQANEWRLLWRAYEGSGQSRRALRALETYVSLRPADTTAALALARAYANRDWGKVLRYAGQVERANPHNLGAKLLRIEATLRGARGRVGESQIAESAAELAALREANPRSVGIRLLQALIAVGQGRLDDAIAELEHAVSDTDEPLIPALQLLQLHAQAGRTEQAIAVATSAMERHPDVAVPATALAELLASSGQADRAEKTLREAIARLTGREKVRAVLTLARHLLSKDDRSPGIELLSRFAVDHPDDVQSRLVLSELPEVRDDAEKAQELVDELRGIEGERGVRWRVAQAVLWLRQADWRSRQEAIEELLRDSIQTDRGWSAPVLALGSMYELSGRDRQAEELYRGVLAALPEQIEVVSQLVALFERQRRFAEAASLLEGMPEVPKLSEHRVITAVGLGEYDAAIEQLRQRTAADPGNVGAKITLAKLLYSHHGDVGGALDLLDEAQTLAPDLLTAITAKTTILHAEGRNSEVITLLDNEVKRRGDFAAYLLRGAYFATIGEVDQAEQDYVHLTTVGQSAVDGYASLGEFYQRLGRTDEAIAAWEAGLKIAPNDDRMKRMLLAALVASPRMPDRERSRAMLRGLLARAPDDPDVLSAQADLLLADGTPEAIEQATDTLDRVTGLDPRNVGAYLRLIQLARQDGNLSEARRLAVRGLGANPYDVALLLVRAGLEAELDNVRVARQLAESVLEIHPRNVAAYNLLSGLALLAGEIESARALNEKALEFDNLNEIAQETHAKILIAGGQYDQALRDLESYRGTGEGGGSVVTLLALAALYRERGDFDTAGERLDEAAELAPGDSSVFGERLRWLAAQDRFDEIVKRLAEHRVDQPGELQALLVGGGLLASAGEEAHVRTAKSLFEQAIAYEPNSVDGHLGLARVAYLGGEVELAERSYWRVLELEPYHEQALNDLAWILVVELDRVEEALSLADKGVARYPDDPHLLDTRSVVFLKLGRTADARRDLEECVRNAADLPATRARALFHLAQVCFEENSLADAKAKLAEALEIDGRSHVFNDRERQEIAQLSGKLSTAPSEQDR